MTTERYWNGYSWREKVNGDEPAPVAADPAPIAETLPVHPPKRHHHEMASHPNTTDTFHTDPVDCPDCAKAAPEKCAAHAARADKRRDRSEDETPPASPRPMRNG